LNARKPIAVIIAVRTHSLGMLLSNLDINFINPAATKGGKRRKK
jgi:hypothetical protein